MYMPITTLVTGFWKTDQNVTHESNGIPHLSICKDTPLTNVWTVIQVVCDWFNNLLNQ